MADDEVLDAIRDVTVEVVDCAPGDVRAETSFRDELDVDSVDLVEIAHGLEQRLGVRIDDDEIYEVETVGQLVDLLESKR